MGRETKTFVCVVFHHSNIRPRGLEMAEQFVDGWIEAELPFELVVLDNESTVKFDCLNKIKHHYIRVDNQIDAGGCTGAWNTLCEYAIDNDADVIMGFADDVKPNNSLLTLANETQDDNVMYVPLTDGMINTWIKQKSNAIKPNYREYVSSVNGFWLSFTKGFWKEKQVNKELFIKMNSPYIDEWAGQELMMQVWNNKYKTQGLIVGDTWLHHTKLRSWKDARNKY